MALNLPKLISHIIRAILFYESSILLWNLISNKILPLQFVQTLNKSWMKRHRYWFANGPKNFCKSSSHLWGSWHFIWLTKCLWTISHLQLTLCFLPWLNLEMVSTDQNLREMSVSVNSGFTIFGNCEIRECQFSLFFVI